MATVTRGPSMQKSIRVALDVETARIYGRHILEGIAKYLKTTKPWSVYLEEHELDRDPREFLKRWDGEAIITRSILTPEAVDEIKRRQLVVVDVGDMGPPTEFTRIQSADSVIGSIAAKHLLERGFESLACCSFSKEHWSARRREGFAAEVRQHGFTASCYESWRAGKQTWQHEQSELVEWLRTLPKPVGVFATNDLRGQHVLEACRRIDLAVPESVAVVGVDNDEVLCGLCQPQLTSIIPDSERIGYEAAYWLDRILAGSTDAPAAVEVPPRGIAVRQSSDVYAVSDPTVAAALRFIREHACEGISVSDVLEHISVSRSWLERQFRKYVNHSPQVEIRTVQVRRCKELLKSTTLPLEKIAGLTGFDHPEYMSVVFKRETKETPGRYRKRHADGRS